MQAQAVLKEKFGYDHFREGQADVIESLLAGTNVLAIMRLVAGSRYVTRFQR